MRHKVPGLTAALASYLRRLRALPDRLPSRTRLAGPLGTQAGGRMLTLAGAAACVVLGVIAVGGDTSPLSHAMAFRTAQLASPPGTTATTPATSATGSATPAAPSRAPAPAPPATASCQHSPALACSSPRQIQRAYAPPSLYGRGLDGRGRTIVIVDSFGSPT